jgi:hypothetical protein
LPGRRVKTAAAGRHQSSRRQYVRIGQFRLRIKRPFDGRRLANI